MEVERIRRYRDKINIILKRNEQINAWTSEYSAEDFLSDEKTMLATYKAFQDIVEACMDMIAMLCKDRKVVPKDDYTNIEGLDFVDKELKRALTEANGLRNRLVHRYNRMDDIIAFDGIKDLSSKVIMFVEVVEEWIGKSLKEK